MKKLLNVLLLFSVCWIIGCPRSENSFGSNGQVKEKIPVRIQGIILQDLTETIGLVGTVEPLAEATIFPKIFGRVETLSAEKGQIVKANDSLAVLEHSSITAQVEQTEAGLMVSQAQLKQGEINLNNLVKERDRMKSLTREGAASTQKLDQVETQYQTAQSQYDLVKAQIQQTEALLRQVRIQEKEAYIVTPITGIIAERFMDIGDMANPGLPFFKIVQVSIVKIISALSEEELSRVFEGQTKVDIKIDAYPDERFEGKVTRIAPTIDQRNRTAEIEVRLNNPDLKLKPGMFARLTLLLETKKNIIVLDRDVLVCEDDKYFVYVAHNNIAHKREVKLGMQTNGQVEIKDGLDPEEKIITTVGSNISDNAAVMIIE